MAGGTRSGRRKKAQPGSSLAASSSSTKRSKKRKKSSQRSSSSTDADDGLSRCPTPPTTNNAPPVPAEEEQAPVADAEEVNTSRPPSCSASASPPVEQQPMPPLPAAAAAAGNTSIVPVANIVIDAVAATSSNSSSRTSDQLHHCPANSKVKYGDIMKYPCPLLCFIVYFDPVKDKPAILFAAAYGHSLRDPDNDEVVARSYKRTLSKMYNKEDVVPSRNKQLLMKEIQRRRMLDPSLADTPKGAFANIKALTLVTWLQNNVIKDEYSLASLEIEALVGRMEEFHLRKSEGGDARMLRECRLVEAILSPSHFI